MEATIFKKEGNSLIMKKCGPKVKKEVIEVNVYKELAKYPVFSIEEVQKLTGNVKTAYSQLYRLMKKDLVRKIRRNIYSPVNPVIGQVVASRYQIACAITDTAYISHHSAFEYYGLANQVFYEVYVSSETKFNNFEYDYLTYKYIASKMREGIIEAKNTTGVRITDLERTVIDSIRDFNKISGFEELLNCLEGLHYLDENKLRRYLDIYDIQGLYQKVGYLLDHYRKEIQLSKSFINYCKGKIGRSRRYLLSETNEKCYYNSEWELMVPEGLFKITEQGGDILV
jgi:predicted transcriptional regulator of viral defense system